MDVDIMNFNNAFRSYGDRLAHKGDQLRADWNNRDVHETFKPETKT